MSRLCSIQKVAIKIKLAKSKFDNAYLITRHSVRKKAKENIEYYGKIS
jgi:uncharacterized membrane protein